VPFALGGVLAIVMVRSGGFFTEHVRPFHAVLFLARRCPITAFPMLARIISERGIAGTTIGSLALAAGAMDDAAAWIILAIVLSSFTGNAMFALSAAGARCCTWCFVFLGVRRFPRPTCGAAERDAGVSAGTFVTVALPARVRRVVHRPGRHSLRLRRIRARRRRPARRGCRASCGGRPSR